MVQIRFSSDEELNRLVAQEDVWEVNHRAGYVVALVSVAHMRELRGSGLNVSLDEARTDDLLAQIARFNEPAVLGIPGYGCYRTVSETEARLEELATLYPTLVQRVDIGDSWEKLAPEGGAGHDLWSLVLTNQAKEGPKFRFALMGAIHARELVTAETVLRFAEELLAGYGNDPDATWLLDYGELHILPIANPDGRILAEGGEYWRKNTNSSDACTAPPTIFQSYGVDLNRNSSFKWNECVSGSCSSSEACSMVYRGRTASSEPETQAIQGWLTSLFDDMRGPELTDPAPETTTGLFLSLHSYARLVLYPWGWTSDPPPNDAALRTLGEHFAYYTSYDVCQIGEPGCLYNADGLTDDWLYGERGVASYTIEIGYEFFESCTTFEEVIYPDMRTLLRYGFKAARLPYQLPSGPEAISASVTPTRVVAGEAVTLTVHFNEVSKGANLPPVDESPELTGTVHIQAGRWWKNAPSWLGEPGLPMTAADGAFDAPSEVALAVLDTTGWPLGRHTIYFEGQQSSGVWGVTGALFVDIVQKQIIGPIQNPGPPWKRYLPAVMMAGAAE